MKNIYEELVKLIKINELTIYQDLDGCLCDFEKAFENLGHGTFEEVEGQSYVEDPAKAWNLIAKAGEKYWSEMPWMSDGKFLWKYVKQFNVKILSAPIHAKSSHTGKKKWVQKNLGRDIELILSPSNKKYRYADSKSILIDDRESNIKEWRKAGGIGILHTDAKTTIDKLRRITFK